MTPAAALGSGLVDGTAGIPLSPSEFSWFIDFLRHHSGIELKEGKQSLVMSRLERRLRAQGVGTYREYFELISSGSGAEAQLAIDLMTTNETYFFREQQHFDMLPRLLPPTTTAERPFRVWSAASSSGEEAYSVALTMAAHDPGGRWEVLGTDLSTRILRTAGRALYPIEAAERIPQHLRTAHCLRGRGEHEGFFTLDPSLRSRVTFRQINLMKPFPEIGTFNVIFLRNILIYFNGANKRLVVDRVAATLRPGGFLLTSHAETLMGLDTSLEMVAPSVYQRKERD